MIEIKPDAVETVIIELLTIIAAIIIIGIVVYIKIKYSQLTKKGYSELILGFGIFTFHLLFDLLDTLVAKKVNEETTFIYSLFDLLDAIFSFLGLFIIGYAFYKIAKSGMEIWKGEGESA